MFNLQSLWEEVDEDGDGEDDHEDGEERQLQDGEPGLLEAYLKQVLALTFIYLAICEY